MYSYFIELPRELLYLILSYSPFNDIKVLTKGLELYIDHEELIRINYPKIYTIINNSKFSDHLDFDLDDIEFNIIYKTLIYTKFDDDKLEHNIDHDEFVRRNNMIKNLLSYVAVYKIIPEILKYNWPNNEFLYDKLQRALVYFYGKWGHLDIINYMESVIDKHEYPITHLTVYYEVETFYIYIFIYVYHITMNGNKIIPERLINDIMDPYNLNNIKANRSTINYINELLSSIKKLINKNN